MTAAQVFALSGPAILLGWLILAWAIFRQNDWLRDVVAGRLWPFAFSAFYTLLILLFFAKAPGGFGSLADVQLLFTNGWAALAGWLHYLAFDLFMGAIIARRVMEDGLSRLWLVPLLPLTFLFGPIGYAASEVLRLAAVRAPQTQEK